MKVLKVNLGIDAGKDSCYCNLSVLTEELRVKVIASRKFDNTSAGLAALLKWIEKNLPAGYKTLRVTIEASGVYYEQFALGLQKAAHRVSVVLPNKAKDYMKGCGFKSKNDKIDAQGLAKMGCEQELQEWTPLSSFFYELRSYTRLHEDLQEQKTMAINKLHAVNHSAQQIPGCADVLQTLVDTFDAQLDKTMGLIHEHIAGDAQIKEKIEKICEFKGVGLLTVATVVAEANGFDLFRNIPQVVSYAGYDVIEDQSGKRVGKTKISKKGNSHIRRALYMPGLNMKRWEVGAMPALYERTFKKHGIKMKSYVALQKKVLILIYTLWKKNEKFDETYHLKVKKQLPARVEEVETSSRVSLAEAGKAA